VKSVSSSIKSKKKKSRKYQTTTDIFANSLSEAVHDAAAYGKTFVREKSHNKVNIYYLLFI
jgi:hypothetical protein